MTNAINYVNCMLIDFASENDLELYLKSREEIMTSELYDRLAAAGPNGRLCPRSGIRTSSGYLRFLNIVPKMPSRNVGQYEVNWNVQSS